MYVSLKDLQEAFEFVSATDTGEHQAFFVQAVRKALLSFRALR
jgi:hypothetical protein